MPKNKETYPADCFSFCFWEELSGSLVIDWGHESQKQERGNLSSIHPMKKERRAYSHADDVDWTWTTTGF